LQPDVGRVTYGRGMSEETTAEHVTPYDFDNDPDGFVSDDFREEDPLLQHLLGVVPGKDGDNELGITVTVNGVVISGRAVSSARWQKLWTRALRESNEELGDEFNLVVPNSAKDNADMVARREAENRPIPAPFFLHLTDAEIVTGGFRRHVGLMRVQRERIDAWALGQLAD
jgi:hypothetical protein